MEVPKVSTETKEEWAKEIASKVQKKLERTSKKADWAERLEAAAKLGALKETEERLEAHKVGSKKRPKEKAKKDKHKKSHKKRKRSESPVKVSKDKDKKKRTDAAKEESERSVDS